MDRNNIDELFRNKLAGRHLPVNEADFTEAMKLMKKGKGGRGWKWIAGSLIIIAGLTAVAFLFTHKSEPSSAAHAGAVHYTPAESNSQNNNVVQEEAPIANEAPLDQPNNSNENSSLGSPNEGNESTELNSETSSAFKNNKPIAQNQSKNFTSTRKEELQKPITMEERATTSLQKNRALNSEKKGKQTTAKSAGNSSTFENKREDYNSTSNTKSNGISSEGSVAPTIERTKQQNELDALANRSTRNAITNKFEVATQPNSSQNPFSASNTSELEPVFSRLSSRAFNPFTISRPTALNGKALLYIGNTRAIATSPWSLQLRTSYGPQGVKYSGENPSKDYLKNRANQENKSNAVGVELHTQYSLGNYFVGTGLGYSAWQESANYQTTISGTRSYEEYQTLTRDTSFFVYFPSGGAIDSVLVDSTITYLALVQVVENFDSLGPKFSTTMQWKTISIPLRFGYQKKLTAKDALAFEVGADLLYAVSRTGNYLSLKQDTIGPISSTGQYRKFGLNGYAAIEYRRYLVVDKWFVAIAPEVRYSLLSWNKDFGHRYLSPSLRLSIGMKF